VRNSKLVHKAIRISSQSQELFMGQAVMWSLKSNGEKEEVGKYEERLTQTRILVIILDDKPKVKVNCLGFSLL
jgi:hypothetical protein